jgi:hypothetical protein
VIRVAGLRVACCLLLGIGFWLLDIRFSILDIDLLPLISEKGLMNSILFFLPSVLFPLFSTLCFNDKVDQISKVTEQENKAIFALNG